ncbi:MAG: RNA polymerase sigma-I factor [Peptostreptococcaceae bacterium]|nr:RNA polymerase sigma-I factor [Peptostreptococcaceae bacterium]
MGTLAERVVLSKVDRTMREELIREYMPFILSCASKQSGRYIRQGTDDESGIAMMAFDEAITKYVVEKGGFLSLAKQIISRRLIDDYRKRNSKDNAIPVDFTNNGDNRIKSYEVVSTNEAYRLGRESEDRAEEIEVYKKELGSWGISFDDLVKNSPKHERLRHELKELAVLLTRDDDVMDELMRTHRLPINKIMKKKPIPRKRLERGRIYILSLLVVLTGDYRYIREYIDWR